MAEKIKNYLPPLLLLIFMITTIIFQSISNFNYMKNYWVVYVVNLVIIAYIFYRWKDSENSENTRRLYYTLLLTIILYLIPNIKSMNMITKGLGSLSIELTTIIIIFISAVIIYLLIISDAHISEVSIGNNKVSLLKKECVAQISEHEDISELLNEKIIAEAEVIKNMHLYASNSISKIGNDDYCFENEFQSILNQYYSAYRNKNDIIASVYNIQKIDDIKMDFELNRGEISKIEENIKNNEITTLDKINKYLMFISYEYLNLTEVVIVLQSRNRFLTVVEGLQITNILSIFITELILLLNIEKNNNV